MSDALLGLAARLDAHALGDSLELVHVGNLVGRLALGGEQEHLDGLKGVVAVGRCAAGRRAQQVAGHDSVRVGAADAVRGLSAKRVDAAGTLEAVAAADAQLAETALGLHGLVAVVTDGDAILLTLDDHLLDCRIDILILGLPGGLGLFPFYGLVVDNKIVTTVA